MTNEIYEKLLNALLAISKNLEPRHLWVDYSFWIGSVNILVLAFTLYWLIRYTRATEKMMEGQMMPAVEVNMVYENNLRTTHFWFSNSSNIPALVSLELTRSDNQNKQQVGPLRIPPNHPHRSEFRRTGAIDFLNGNLVNDLKIVVKVVVMSAVDGAKKKMTFTKSYRFNSAQSCWNETSWGYPDPSFI